MRAQDTHHKTIQKCLVTTVADCKKKNKTNGNAKETENCKR